MKNSLTSQGRSETFMEADCDKVLDWLKVGYCNYLGVYQWKHAFVFFFFAASRLLAFPLNVYRLVRCRWRRNLINAASTIPVRGFSDPCRKTIICSLLQRWICWGKRIAAFTVNIASVSLVGLRAILKHKWRTQTVENSFKLIWDSETRIPVKFKA